MSEMREFPTWQDVYLTDVERMPWFFPELDPDLQEALDARGIVRGRVLDVGTGPGTQAIALARRGLDVVATDIAPAAIARARDRGRREGVHVDWREDNIVESRLTGPFDWAFDRGCFHVLFPEQRATYVARMHTLLRPRGLLFLKCFSRLQPGEHGPHRFTSQQIHAMFTGPFHVASVRETVYHGPIEPPPRALFCVLERV